MAKIVEPREFTAEEVREQFIRHVWAMVQFWSQQKGSNQSRVEGVAWSILAALDGSALSLPGFMVVPLAAPEDKEYLNGNGENWYREIPAEVQKQLCDISGTLHDVFSTYGRNHGLTE